MLKEILTVMSEKLLRRSPSFI